MIDMDRVESEISDEEWASTENEIIEEVKDFAKKSSEYYGKFLKRVKADRKFASGEQWSKDDDTNRGEDRAKLTFNMCSVFEAAVVNPFAARPFKFKAVARLENEAGTTDPLARTAVKQYNDEIMESVNKLNGRLTELQNDYCTNETNTQGLKDEVQTGIGFSYATIDEVLGEKKIKYLHIEDQAMVVLDPDAKGVALENSDRIAVVDFMRYSKAKEQFGEDIVVSKDTSNAKLTNFGSSWEVPKDHVAIITYYRKDGHNVEYFRLCGDHIVDYGVFEGLEYLPVFAFTGDKVWLEDKRTYAGIIRKIKNEQLVINYSQSQLIERLAKSPKGFFLGYKESFEGNEECFQNAEFGTSYILEANAVVAGNDNKLLPLPQFIQPHVLTDDLQAVINQSINQMSVATGISPNGIVEQNLTDQKTATEVLLRTKSSQSNVSNYISHAKETIRIAGSVLAHLCVLLYGIDLPKGSYDIVVEEGCVSLTKMEEDREKLLALAQIVPDEFKPLISQKLVKTLDLEGGEELSEQLYNMLPAELRGGAPSWQELQAAQLQVQQLNETIAELQQQNKTLNDQLTQAQLRTQSDLIMEDKRHAHEIEMKLLDNAEDEKVNAQKMLFDARREQKAEEHDLKKTIIDAKAKLTDKALGVIEKGMQTQNVPNLS